MIQTKRCTSESKDFRDLLFSLDLDGTANSTSRSISSHHSEIDSIDSVIVAYQNECPIGYGFFKRYDNRPVLIKSTYVKKDFKDQGIDEILLHELNDWANENC